MMDQLVLPCLARSEEADQANGPQAVTVELPAYVLPFVQRAVSPSVALRLG